VTSGSSATRGLNSIAVVLLFLSLVACATLRHVEPSPRAPAKGAAVMATAAPPRSVEAATPNGGRAPAFSPDGTQIAFLSSTLHTPPDLWVMNADGSGARRLTIRGAQAFRWAADSQSIVFASRRKGYEEILTIGLDGSEERRIPGVPPNASLPLSSPDGRLFAFTAPGEQNVRDLWIGTADRTRIEAVTEKISVRSLVWSQDSRKIYYEAGKAYGVGIWEMDLASMEAKVLLSKYIGTPVFSPAAGLFAFPFPTSPGQFEVHTMGLDGAIKQYKAPRLEGRWLAWDAAGKGVFYLGKDLEKLSPEEKSAKAAKKDEQPAAPHDTGSDSDTRKVGVTALWRMDLATGAETRVSPASLHLTDFDLAPGGGNAVVTGVLEKSPAPELFSLDLSSGALHQMVGSRASAWMPVPSHDASKIAFFTNEGTLDSLKVSSHTGEELAAYPGLVLEGDTRLLWLPGGGLAVFSGRGLFAFTENGPIEFPNRGDHRTFLYTDASIQEDKVLLSAIPRYGESPGLYVLEAGEGKFAQRDLRYPSAPEIAAELYLQPKWSFDGKKIAFTDGIDVWTMKADGTDRRWITSYAQEKQEGKGRDAGASFPVWSVRGDRICYTLTVHEPKRVLRELWLMQADGSAPKMLHSEELDSQFQVFQPEYTSAPFFDSSDRHVIATALHHGLPNVVSIDLADGKMTALTETGATFPAMLPEEDAIVYTSLEGNDERIWIMNADGTEKRRFLKPTPTQGGTGGGTAATP